MINYGKVVKSVELRRERIGCSVKNTNRKREGRRAGKGQEQEEVLSEADTLSFFHVRLYQLLELYI